MYFSVGLWCNNNISRETIYQYDKGIDLSEHISALNLLVSRDTLCMKWRFEILQRLPMVPNFRCHPASRRQLETLMTLAGLAGVVGAGMRVTAGEDGEDLLLSSASCQGVRRLKLFGTQRPFKEHIRFMPTHRSLLRGPRCFSGLAL